MIKQEQYTCFASGLWWTSEVMIERITSGRWKVKTSSVQANNVMTLPISEIVYAPVSCKTEHEALCWASHSKAWERLRIHSQGSRLLSEVKSKYPDQECRKELFSKFCSNLTDEFFPGWLFKNQDAQDIVARVILGLSSSRHIADNFLEIKQQTS